MDKFKQYIKTNREAFLAKVELFSNILGIRPEWLLSVMLIESGINEKAVNPVSGATGLIQFMPRTAQSLGTSTEELRAMNNVEQLKYVYRYLSPFKGKMRSLFDVYFAVFFPLAIGKPNTFVMETKNLSAQLIAKQNPAYDINKDGKVTVAEVKAKINELLKKKVIFETTTTKKRQLASLLFVAFFFLLVKESI